MLSRSQIQAHLLALGFTSAGDCFSLPSAGLHVQLLDASRVVATSPKGLAYIAVLSGPQLAEQLAHLAGG